VFELFDPTAEVQITSGRLPHWYQPGVTYFITFRTDDSFPSAVARQWYGRRDQWLRDHGIDPAAHAWESRLRQLPDKQSQEFHSTFSREFMEHLDKGHGECVLRRAELARIVAESLHYFDGQRYHLGDFVVMPQSCPSSRLPSRVDGRGRAMLFLEEVYFDSDQCTTGSQGTLLARGELRPPDSQF
jgi:REP-associated tyrosine transposase